MPSEAESSTREVRAVISSLLHLSFVSENSFRLSATVVRYHIPWFDYSICFSGQFVGRPLA